MQTLMHAQTCEGKERAISDSTKQIIEKDLLNGKQRTIATWTF